MPVADLPYHIEKLASAGQYAYLTRPTVRRAKVNPPQASEDEAPTIRSTRLRVLRRVTLCDGPGLWDSLRVKSPDPYAFYVELRLFATRIMVEDYLASPELASYCQLTSKAPPTLNEGDMVITEQTYLSEAAVKITKSEYARNLQSRDYHSSIERLEAMVCQLQGIDSLESLAAPKRGRKKAAVTPNKTPCILNEGVECSEPEGIIPAQPAVMANVVVKKRKSKVTLRDQFVLVQNTPSRIIDVSNFGDTMQHQRGRILDRVKHAERIAQCTVLPDFFPVISDNIPGFERAMSSLGSSRYAQKVEEFKALHAVRQKS